MDDIILIDADSLELKAWGRDLPKFLKFGPLKYFLEIEFARSKEDIFMNQWKYILERDYSIEIMDTFK